MIVRAPRVSLKCDVHFFAVQRLDRINHWDFLSARHSIVVTAITAVVAGKLVLEVLVVIWLAQEAILLARVLNNKRLFTIFCLFN